MKEKITIWKRYWLFYHGINYQAWLLLIALLINRIGYMAVLFLPLYFKTVLHFSLNQVGFLLSSYGVGSICGTCFGGVLSDYVRPTNLLTLAFLLTACLYFFLPLIGDFYLLFGFLLVIGISASIGQPAGSIALYEYVSVENRLKVFGLYRVINNIGVSIAGFFGGYLASYSFKYLFYVNSISMLVAAIILLVLKEQMINNEFKLTKKNIQTSISLIEVLKNRHFMFIWWLLLGSLMIFAQVTTTYPIYLNQSYHLDTNEIGLIFALNGTIITVFQVPLLNYLENCDLSRVASIGILLIGSALGLLPFRNDFFFAAALCVTWTIGEMLTFPVSMTLAIKYIGDHKKGLYMSVYHTAISISGLLFPLLGTYIYQYLSGNTLWFMCFVLSLALMFGYMFVNSARSKLPEKNPASI